MRTEKRCGYNQKIIFHCLSICNLGPNLTAIAQLSYDENSIQSNLDNQNIKRHYSEINKIISLPKSQKHYGSSGNLGSILALLNKDLLINVESDHHKYLHVFASGTVKYKQIIYPIKSLIEKLITVHDYLDHYHIDPNCALLLFSKKHEYSYNMCLNDSSLNLPSIVFIPTVKHANLALQSFYIKQAGYTKLPRRLPPVTEKIFNDPEKIFQQIIVKDKNRTYEIKKNYYRYKANLNYYTPIMNNLLEFNCKLLESLKNKKTHKKARMMVEKIIMNNFDIYSFDKTFLTEIQNKYPTTKHLVSKINNNTGTYIQEINGNFFLYMQKCSEQEVEENIQNAIQSLLKNYFDIDTGLEV